MISMIVQSFGWCALQVSLVVVAGVILSTIASRRNSLIACTIVCQAVVTCMVLTVLAPLPLHRSFVLSAGVTAAQADSILVPLPDRNAVSTSENSGFPSTVPMMTVHDLLVAIRSAAKGIERFENGHQVIAQILIGFVVLMIAVGHVRLAMGFAFIRRIRRTGRSITDPGLLSLVRELATQLKCPAIPQVLESPAVVDAAVTGWLRPTLVLPYNWREWNDSECRSVIAHELAHILRRDVLWRFVAFYAFAMHFYNPLVHWLLRRVILYQELAADTIAATVIGRSRYLHSLSSLAIRKDNQLVRDDVTGLLPVYSGYLIRRIKMLHSKEGSMDMVIQNKQTIFSAVVSMTFLLMGLGALATRGIAQPPKDSPNIIKGISFTKRVADSDSRSNPRQEMFHRSPLDPSTIGAGSQNGLVVVRIQELVQRPEIKSFIPALNAFASESMESLSIFKPLPPIDLEAIEWIAFRPFLEFKAETKERKSQVQFGTASLSMKLSQPIDLKNWFERFLPGAPCHVIEGQNVFEVNAVALGPAPLRVWTTDGKTIRFSGKGYKPFTPETKLADLDADPVSAVQTTSETSASRATDGDNSPKWNQTWNRIDRGLLSILIAKANLGGLFADLDNKPDFQNEFAKKAGQILKSIEPRCKATALGFDIQDSNSFLGMKCSFAHTSKESAEQSALEIRELLTAAKAELMKERETIKERGANAGDEQRMICVCIEAMETLTTTSVETYEDGTAATVVSGALPFGTFIELIVQLTKDEVAEENK